MRDIKERVRDKNPKIRNPAARLPKELVRQTVLEQKKSQGNYMRKAVGSQTPQHNMELKK
ncbi:hypothetical protein NKF87_12560 [Dorea longicatena]|nr:hypothetical protein [Dorea longicatena]UTB45059.1 hypothetical protein NKF87_12560 [Dorea longicatena]